MKVSVTGLRGFPDIQGGIETHAQHLYPLLAADGVEVTILGRKPYLKNAVQVYQGVKVIGLPCPRIASLETVIHTLIAVLYCGFISRPDIVHIHAVGPGLFVPLARLLGLRVVFTHHGEDYHRQKWGKFASSLLRLGERVGATHANAVIVISKGIQHLVTSKFKIASDLIPNGVVLAKPTESDHCLKRFGIVRHQYVLIVGRLVPEKRHHDLIDAFLILREQPNWKDLKLVIVGAADHQSLYVKSLLSRTQNLEGVVMAGFQTGEALAQLYKWAGSFCLPSSHEGLPISLLEAMSAGCPVVASNIAPNLEIALQDDEYFELGNSVSLAMVLEGRLIMHKYGYNAEINRGIVASKYNWNSIARLTRAVYSRVGR